MGAFKVIIVGSGLAGSNLANGLMKNNIEVQVYERMRQDSKREGYQIRIGENGLKGMRACLEPPVLNYVAGVMGREGGTRESAPAIYDVNFNLLLDLSVTPGYPKSASINRAVLRDALAQPVEDAERLHYGKQLDGYDIIQQGQHERVRVRFKDGTNEVCDILVAADGSHSAVNKQIGLGNIDDVPMQTMLVKSELPTERMMNMRTDIVRTPVACYKDGVALFWGTYLPDQMDPTSEASKARFRETKGFSERKSSCMLGISMPKENAPAGLAEFSAEDKYQFVKKMVSGWSPVYTEIVEAVHGYDFYVFTPRRGEQPASNWRAKVQDPERPDLGHPRVWFLGDAIHAMLPGRGMGGNQALLDTAEMLPHLIELANMAEQDELPRHVLDTHCNQYEAKMIPRAFDWVRKSDQGMYIDCDTLQSKAFFAVARVVVNAIAVFYSVLGMFMNVQSQEIPELAGYGKPTP